MIKLSWINNVELNNPKTIIWECKRVEFTNYGIDIFLKWGRTNRSKEFLVEHKAKIEVFEDGYI